MQVIPRVGKRMFCLVVLLALLWATIAVARADVFVIDPAHGGNDFGVRSGKAVEKDIALQVALYLKEELKAGKAAVKMTREEDKNPSVKARQDIANLSRATLLVSIHINAGFDKKTAGFEIFLADCAESSINKEMGNGEHNVILGDMLRNRLFNESMRFASSLDKALTVTLAQKSRGVQQAPAPVFKGLNIPALILEIGFVANPEEGKKMQTESYQRKIAQAIAQGIANVGR